MERKTKESGQGIRVNMVFTEENHDFIKTVSRVTGKSMTEFTNIVIEKYREEHPDLYEMAQKILTYI